ncbi:MAG: hypothetical protein SCH39_08020 [Methanosarcinales archaeon]|nr:hypothetical protein [Methanosarcinales archaeon]
MSTKYKVTKEFVKELGEKILNTKEGFIILSVDKYFNSIGYGGERKLSDNINRSIKEFINKVGPADYYFQVNGINEGQDFKFSLIPREIWMLKT